MIKRKVIAILHCKKCDSIIWSRHRHDFRYCKCKACFIDGGAEYTRYGGDHDNIEIHEIEIPKSLHKFSFKQFGKLSTKLNNKKNQTYPEWKTKDILPILNSLHSDVSKLYKTLGKEEFFNFVEELTNIIIKIYNLSSSISFKLDASLEYLIFELYVKTQTNLLKNYKYK